MSIEYIKDPSVLMVNDFAERYSVLIGWVVGKTIPVDALELTVEDATISPEFTSRIEALCAVLIEYTNLTTGSYQYIKDFTARVVRWRATVAGLIPAPLFILGGDNQNGLDSVVGLNQFLTIEEINALSNLSVLDNTIIEAIDEIYTNLEPRANEESI